MSIKHDEALGAIARPGEWRVLPSWPVYEVSEWGALRRCKAATNGHVGRILKPVVRKNRVGPEYIFYQLSNAGMESPMSAHRAVAEAFLGPQPFSGAVVRHLDGDSLHNHYLNLAWGSCRENKQDDRRLGTLAIGERIGSSKLTADEVLVMRHLVRSTGFSCAQVYRLWLGKVTYKHIWNITQRDPGYWTWLHDDNQNAA